MEADVALRAGAKETWTMPPTGQVHAEATPGRGRKAKSKGRGLPQPVASPSPQQKTRRRQQQQQQQYQLRLSRSLDDELDAAVELANVKPKGRQLEATSSSRERLVESDIADALLASGAATRRGSAPGQQSPSASRLEKWTPPKEQKKSSSRNRRRRAAAAAKKHEVGELEGGEAMAQAPVTPDGPEPGLFLDTQPARGSRLPELGARKQEHRQPSMDSLTGRGPRKHSQQSDDGFFSYEPEYDDQKLKSPDSPQIHSSENRLKEQACLALAPSGFPRSGFGYQGNGSDGSGRGRRREKGAVGRVVPKPSEPHDSGSSLYGSGNDGVPSGIGLGSEDRKSSERVTRAEEVPAFYDPHSRSAKDPHQKTVPAQTLADPHYGKGQIWAGRPSDQMYIGDPSQHHRGPNLIPVSSSSADTESLEPSGSVVILEVKDRPGLYYKSSVRTVSDSLGMGPPHDPAIFASSASRLQSQPQVPQQAMVPPQSMGSPRPIVPPQSVSPQQFQQFYSHPNYIPVSHLAQHGYSAPHPGLTPTQLTYSPQLNQSPLMSPQQQMFTPAKTIPLDLSFSPRNTPTAHSAYPASHHDQTALMYPPAPAHCPPNQPKPAMSHPHASSPSPSPQSKLPGLRRPNLSALQQAVSEDIPLDLSTKKTFPPSSASPASSGKCQEGTTKVSPITPPPLDLRTNITASNGAPVSDVSWAPCSAAPTITDQPVGIARGLVSADYTHAASRQTKLVEAVHPESCSGPPIEHQPIPLAHSGSNPTPVVSTCPEKTTVEITAPSLPSTTSLSVTPSTIASTTSSAGQPPTESETAGFLNKSEFIQQRAGIKHDDIVVGPRRPISTLLTTPIAKLKDNSGSSQSYNTFPPSHSKPGATQAEEDQPQKDASQTENQASRLKLKLPSQIQRLDNQTQPYPTSPATEQSPSGGSQTIPRRIPRKVQPDSPQNARKKAGGSRLPKPMHGHSPDPTILTDAKLSVVSPHTDDTPTTGESVKQPLLTDASMPRDRTLKKSPKSNPQSTETSPSSAYGPDSKPTTNFKNHPESSNGNSALAGSSLHPGAGKPRQAKPAGKSGLPQSVATTPPAKRKETASKLHMLSNIPVPMCHDPRPKPGVLKSQQNVEEEEEEEASDKTPLLRPPAAANSGFDNGHAADHTNKSQTDAASESCPSSQTSASKSSFAANGSVASNNVSATSPSRNPTHQRSPPTQVSRAARGPRSRPGQAQRVPVTRGLDHVTPTSSAPRATTQIAAASVPSSPGTHGELFKVGSYPTTSSASALLDSSVEIERSPPIVKKKSNLPRIGILRRGSDRTAEFSRRGGAERAILAGIPLSSRRHDPSVEDLKRATSISELCQSVASLLNIGEFF
ncbi:hypothetical protein EGW08_005126 [Elysia chlorotica]|uniref:Uncharacterized protein n=1 Tax=Elysia chlorotica TaxID=188477 RepID=A0A3S1BMK0_ELYCH|nr:hypothetical protein EGW08_005126 [Elysia chlorotica]